MSNKKLACLAAATMIGVALIAAPAQARGAGGLRAATMGQSVVGRPGFAGRAGWRGHHRFLGPLLGFGLGLGVLDAAAYSSCWTSVQTPFGSQRVWAVSHCNLGYGGDFDGPRW